MNFVTEMVDEVFCKGISNIIDSLNTVDIWVCDVYLLQWSEFISEKHNTSLACENWALRLCVGCCNCLSRVSGEAYFYAEFRIGKTWF